MEVVMRGRKPETFVLKAKDKPILHELLRDGQLNQRVARRARILLCRAGDQRVIQVADKVDRNSSTVWRVCERYRQDGLATALYDAPRSGRPRVFPPRVRKQIEHLACQEPLSVGWNILCWSTRSLEQAADELPRGKPRGIQKPTRKISRGKPRGIRPDKIEQDIVTSIDHSTINDILRAGHLQPHRFRYWKTTIWDPLAVARTLRILWYYKRIAWLWQQDIIVIALDEKPGIQVLERAAAKQLMRAGQNELPRGKPRGIQKPTRKISRGKPRGIRPDKIED
jgi:transposase